MPNPTFSDTTRIECRACGETTSSAWCAVYREHPGLCCECFDAEVRKAKGG